MSPVFDPQGYTELMRHIGFALAAVGALMLCIFLLVRREK